MAQQVHQGGWVSLGTPPEELWLANTLVTGQSFRWRRTDDSSSPHDTYTGVIGQRLVQMWQLPADVIYRVLARSPSEDPSSDAAVLQDYFHLSTSLQQLSHHWAARDPRYAAISPALPGCRMLRQDPVECLFQFICSSNNHISRIHGMVERLCSTYGTPLLPSSTCSSMGEAAGSITGGALLPQQQQQQQLQQPLKQGSADLCLSSPGTPAAVAAGWAEEAAVLLQQEQQQLLGEPSSPPLPFAAAEGNLSCHQQQEQQQLMQQQDGLGDGLPSFFAFPTLEQLSAATEEALRGDGFGYRAKYIVGSVQALLEKPEGGRAWLLGLREKPYAEAHEALCSLPGVGPKVAACICLFSLDKHDAIPVDTHVWNLATRYYAPHLAKKSLTPKLHAEVQQAFVDRFGPYAGWAHNCLFIGELASHRHLLPSGAAATAAAAGSGGKKKRKSQESPGAAMDDAVGTPFSAAAEAAGAVLAAAAAAGHVLAAAKGGDAAVLSTPGQGWEGVLEAEGEAAAAATVRRRRRRPAKQLEAAAVAAAADAVITPETM